MLIDRILSKCRSILTPGRDSQIRPPLVHGAYPDDFFSGAIISFNMNALFLYYEADLHTKALELIEAMMENDVHTVVIQEAWEESVISTILSTFPYCYVAIPPTGRRFYLGENSGLVTISKFPIVSQTFTRHPYAVGTCRLAIKGAQAIRFRDFAFTLINTHCQSFHKKISIKQLSLLVEQYKNNPTFILGDLNISSEDLHFDSRNCSVISGNEATCSCGRALDHAVLVNMETRRLPEKHIMSEVKLSDHFPVLYSWNTVDF